MAAQSNLIKCHISNFFTPLVEKSARLKTYIIQRPLTTLNIAAPTVFERVIGGK